VTLVPGKKVAILLDTNPSGAAVLIALVSRCQEVSCKNKKTPIIVAPSKPTVHQNSRVHDRLDDTNADSVGPATLPKFRAQWNAVKALPLWWRKNKSTRMRGPRTPVTPPKKPEKNRDTMNALNWPRWVIRAAQIWVIKQQINVQKMTELRPSL